MSKTSEKLAPLVRETGWSYNLIIMEQCEGDRSGARVLHPHEQQIRSSVTVGRMEIV